MGKFDETLGKMQRLREMHAAAVAETAKGADRLDTYVRQVREVRGALVELQKTERSLAKAVADAVAEVQLLLPSVVAGLGTGRSKAIEKTERDADALEAELAKAERKQATVSVASSGDVRALMVEESGPDGKRVRMYAMGADETPQQALERVADGNAVVLQDVVAEASLGGLHGPSDPRLVIGGGASGAGEAHG